MEFMKTGEVWRWYEVIRVIRENEKYVRSVCGESE
jgi:hypothetical protein